MEETEEPPDNVLTITFLLFGAMNHLMIELMRRFIMSRPPGRIMVRQAIKKMSQKVEKGQAGAELS